MRFHSWWTKPKPEPTRAERADAWFFLQGACRTQAELDELWLSCFGYPNPASPRVVEANS